MRYTVCKLCQKEFVASRHNHKYCHDCSNEANQRYHQKYYLNHHIATLKKSRKNYLKNKDKIAKRSKQHRQTLDFKIKDLTRKFKIDYILAEKLLSIKKCEICDDNFAIATDHNHQTGKVRGKLCYRCNRALGAFKDNLQILKNAVYYLETRNK